MIMENNETYEYYINKYGKKSKCHSYGDNFLIINTTDIDIIFCKDSTGYIWHRLDGPAYINSTGEVVWYINDFDVTYEIEKWAKDRDIDLNNLTDVDKFMIKIEWANYDPNRDI